MHKKITIFGGGTGMSYLLRGLKDFPIDITAVITVSDNGRSTGVLREEFNQPAVGDIRKVISNLSNSDPVIKKIMEYRFKTSSDLNGHCLGNLILTALLNETGSLKESIHALSRLFSVKTNVLPLSEDSSLTLMGELEDGTIIEGETEITKTTKKIKKLFYNKEPEVLKEVIHAVEHSDLIIFSMGSLYTSILPNIICKQVGESLKRTKAPIMYLCNAMTQPGETDDFTVSDHINLINSYLIDRKIDVVIANSMILDENIISKYETEESKDPVVLDKEKLLAMDVDIIDGNLLVIVDDMIRHDTYKLASEIFAYLMRR